MKIVTQIHFFTTFVCRLKVKCQMILLVSLDLSLYMVFFKNVVIKWQVNLLCFQYNKNLNEISIFAKYTTNLFQNKPLNQDLYLQWLLYNKTSLTLHSIISYTLLCFLVNVSIKWQIFSTLCIKGLIIAVTRSIKF